MAWLDGFSRATYSHSPGLDYTRQIRGIVFHTTEGGSAAGAFSVYAGSPSCPHITVDPAAGTRYQHVDTDLGAYALRNLSGGVETNRAGVIQIEIVGFAGEAWSWSTERLRWLGEQVVAPILRSHPAIPNAVYGGAGRMSAAEWDAWAGGLCGHRNVPENDHWDPGDLNLVAVLSYARSALTTAALPPIPPEAPEMDQATFSAMYAHALGGTAKVGLDGIVYLTARDGNDYPVGSMLVYMHTEAQDAATASKAAIVQSSGPSSLASPAVIAEAVRAELADALGNG